MNETEPPIKPPEPPAAPAKKPNRGFFGRVVDKASGVMPRLSSPLTADKTKFNVGSLQGETKRRLREVLVNSLADPEFVAAMELPSAAGASLGPAPAELHALDEDTIEFALGLLSQVQMKIAQRRGYTELQTSILEMTPDRAKKYMPRLMVIADKHLPKGILGKWEDELLFMAAYTNDTIKLWKAMGEAAPGVQPGPHQTPADVLQFTPPGA